MENPRLVKRYYLDINAVNPDEPLRQSDAVIGQVSSWLRKFKNEVLFLCSKEQADLWLQQQYVKPIRVTAVTIITTAMRDDVNTAKYVEARRQKFQKDDTLRDQPGTLVGFRRMAHCTFPWHPQVTDREAMALEMDVAVKKGDELTPIDQRALTREIGGVIHKGKLYVVNHMHVWLDAGEDLVSTTSDWAIQMRTKEEILQGPRETQSHLTQAIFRRLGL